MRHFYCAMLERTRQHRHQSAGINAALFNEGGTLTCSIQPWFEFAEFRRADRPRSLHVLRLSSEQDCAIASKVDAGPMRFMGTRSCLVLKLANKLRIHLCTRNRQLAQLVRQGAAMRRQHPGSGVGGLSPRLAPFDDDNVCA